MSAGADDPLRPIAPLELGLPALPAPPQADLPELRWVDLAQLWVHDGYQRAPSWQSLSLVRRIVTGWDWAKVKALVVVEGAGPDGAPRLEVVDGQHTALAAATLGLARLPALVLGARPLEARADAFVGQNVDRTALTPGQLHYARVAAQQPEALDVGRACARAGITVLRYGTGSAGGINETLAVKTLYAILERRYVKGLNSVLAVCAGARLEPLRGLHLRAVELALFSEFAEARADWPARLSAALLADADGLEGEARLLATRSRQPVWRALAATLARAAAGRRRSAGREAEQ